MHVQKVDAPASASDESLSRRTKIWHLSYLAFISLRSMTSHGSLHSYVATSRMLSLWRGTPIRLFSLNLPLVSPHLPLSTN
ncbi:hypothetical protein TsFJ059_004164 [Trichoderma semiorbis]|uniref:Uncharacterized protein n=1 Tax=Trichoderma semiorbis TaxID=1491008 RepID=A0A9P8KS64_9HYPO|nr:hypothetical protein TsFJ059_004164 [Trichoderma semiorbis]